MRIFTNVVIFGATGETGKFLVQSALRNGYHVRAAVRTPEKLKIQHQNLHAYRSNIYEEESVDHALEGQDAVLVSLAPRSLSLWQRTDLFTQTAKAILPAMQRHQICRLLVVSTTARRETSWDNHPIFEFGIKRLFWRTLYSDVVAMDEMIMSTDFEWTLVRPPQVKNHPFTGQYRVGVGQYALRGGASIGRADLADCMVNLINRPDTFRNNVAVAY